MAEGKRDPVRDWFFLSSPMPAEKKANTFQSGLAKRQDDRTGLSKSTAYSKLVQLSNRLDSMDTEELNSSKTASSEWYSYFDDEKEMFIPSKPVDPKAKPGDDAYAPVQSTDVFDKYYQTSHTYNTSHPITPIYENIVDTIEGNQVTVIEGATGSGKTTQVPQYILDAYATNRRHCNIVCTQPRRIAATSIANFICKERKWQLGTLVGYQIGLSHCISEDTRLTFVTTGVLLQKLISMKNLNQYTHVILDEVHERDQDTDFCLLIVRKLLRTNSPNVKVILMSASIDTHLFRNYFASIQDGCHEPAPLVSVPGKAYNVDLFYLDKLAGRRIGKVPDMDMHNLRITRPMMELCANLIQSFDRREREQESRIRGPRSLESLGIRGTVLVFLPGLPEIKGMDAVLNQLLFNSQLTVIPLHSTVSLSEQQMAFRAPDKGKRKVILATNIAESSITVPDIRYVIDFCLCKELLTDPNTNYQCLQLGWTSKASLEQRKGRAGRVASGECYRLIKETTYKKHLSEYSSPEMQRCPLETTVLRAKLLDSGEPRRLLASALQPPNLENIERTILNLKQVGALSIYRGEVLSPYDGDLTFVGRVLAKLPVDVKIGRLLILGHTFGYLSETLVIAASLSLRSFFKRSYVRAFESSRSKLAYSSNSQSDCIAMLIAYKDWLFRKNTGKFRDHTMEAEWAERNYIQIKDINMVADLVKELEGRLKSFNIQATKQLLRPDFEELDADDILILKCLITGAFYPNYFSMNKVEEDLVAKEMCGLDPNTTVILGNVPPYPQQYRAALCQMFDNCGAGKKVCFQSSKAYIVFEGARPSRQEIERETTNALPSVRMALKLKEFEESLHLFSSQKCDEIEKSNQQTTIKSERFYVTDQNNIQSFEQKPQVTPASSPQKVLKPQVLPKHGQIHLMVYEIVDPGHIWAQRVDTSSVSYLNALVEAINQRPEALQPVARQGQHLVRYPCLAPYSGNGLYYRAVPVSVMENSHLAVVNFVDYGNNELVATNTLRELPLEHCHLPMQAFECFLAGVKPSLTKSPDGQWTKEAFLRFKQLTDGKVLVAEIFSQVQGTLRVFLHDTSEESHAININQQLVMEGYAINAEEPYQSRIAREQGIAEEFYESKRPYYRHRLDWDVKTTFDIKPSLRNSSVRLEDVGSFIQMEWNMADQPYTYAQKTGRYPPNSGQIAKHVLKGPYNPLEASFLSLTSVGQSRLTRIEKDSVNSITLNDAPFEEHSRLMVATNVAINPAGNVVLARNTTILPNLHGLPSLLCLLFSPYVEMRTDSCSTHYTGALCGLGFDPATGESLFPQHDIEISFDVSIQQQDLDLINHLRKAINLAVDSDEETGTTMWGTRAVEKIQFQVKKQLLELLKFPRDSLAPFSYPKPFRWNMVPPLQVVQPKRSTTDQENTDAPFLALHPGIALLEHGVGAFVPPAVKKKKDHIKQLHKMASSSQQAIDVECQLCNQSFLTPYSLLKHLQTKAHQYEESLLLEELQGPAF